MVVLGMDGGVGPSRGTFTVEGGRTKKGAVAVGKSITAPVFLREVSVCVVVS